MDFGSPLTVAGAASDLAGLVRPVRTDFPLGSGTTQGPENHDATNLRKCPRHVKNDIKISLCRAIEAKDSTRSFSATGTGTIIVAAPRLDHMRGRLDASNLGYGKQGKLNRVVSLTDATSAARR